MKDDIKHSPEQIVSMEGISSLEHLMIEDKVLRRVLNNISLLVKRTEIWGINGNSLLEIQLLLEIIANIKPYDQGKCVLIEQGMIKRKRRILRHVFYIGSSDMLYSNMNVLEFLMFATAKSKINKVLLQEEIFELIIEFGLGHLSLTPNYKLTKEEKALIILIAAAYSDSLLIVFNLPEYVWNERLINALAKIAGFIKAKGKTLILATQNCLLIEKACTHIAILKKGRLIYSGLVEKFRLNFDKIEVIIRDKAAQLMARQLAGLLPDYELVLSKDTLLICRQDPVINHCKAISGLYRTIIKAGFTPQAIEVNPKTVQNAYEELIQRHDL